jgi:hypothetical protein
MADPPPPGLPPAGWYADPEMVDTQRYWDGQQWTEHRAPGTPERAKSGDGGGLEVAGWITAVFFPIVGLIIGIVLASQGKKNGIWIVVASLAVMTIGTLLIVAGSA